MNTKSAACLWLVCAQMITHIAEGSLNGEEVCQGHGFDQVQCESIACCNWNNDECSSSVGQGECVLRGEEFCEDRGFDQAQCESIVCCHWNNNYCWSSVGQGECDSESSDDYSGGSDLLPHLDAPSTIFEVVDCSSIPGLSTNQKEKLASLSYVKCCTTGQYNVLVVGTDDYPDSYLLTTSNVIAEILDQNLDGNADNKQVLEGISFVTNSVPPLMQGAPTEEQEKTGDYLGDGENFNYAFSLQTYKAWNDDDEHARQIIVEEVFHMMTQFGWGLAYPSLFGSDDFTSSIMCKEMALASCVHWIHPENTCQDRGTHEDPPIQGTCSEASCDCVEWFHQVALTLGGITPGWYGYLIPQSKGSLRETLPNDFLEIMDDPLYAMPRQAFTYNYVTSPPPPTASNLTAPDQTNSLPQKVPLLALPASVEANTPEQTSSPTKASTQKPSNSPATLNVTPTTESSKCISMKSSLIKIALQASALGYVLLL